MPPAGRRAGLDSSAEVAFALWMKTASYAELEALCSLVQEEYRARGQDFHYEVAYHVRLAAANTGG
jgi:hypothetical protein